MGILGRAAFGFRHPVLVTRYLLTGDKAPIRTGMVRDLARHRRKQVPEFPTALDDLQQYLGLTQSLAATKVAAGGGLVEQRWEQQNPQTPEQVRHFYQHCREYLYELVGWNMGETYQRLLAMLDGERNGTCLSFGGGIGSEALLLAGQGNDVWYCDMPGSPVWEFARWRAQRRNTPIHFTSDVPQDVQFDCVVAYDVFEHLTEGDLECALRKLAGALKAGGRLYCNNAFRVKAGHPMHYNHQQLWDSLVAELPVIKVSESLYVRQAARRGQHVTGRVRHPSFGVGA